MLRAAVTMAVKLCGELIVPGFQGIHAGGQGEPPREELFSQHE